MSEETTIAVKVDKFKSFSDASSLPNFGRIKPDRMAGGQPVDDLFYQSRLPHPRSAGNKDFLSG